MREKAVSTVSADGRTTTYTYDKDGNGIADVVNSGEITSMGETVTTDVILNESGALVQRVVTTTSTDGLLTTVVRGAKPAETTERSSTSDDSYVWKNNVTPTAANAGLVSEPSIDAYGIETWTLTSTILVSGLRLQPSILPGWMTAA